MTGKIEIIFFDIGGVLFTGNGKEVLQGFAAEQDLPMEMLQQVERNHWIPFALGKISEQEYWQGIKNDLRLPQAVSELKSRQRFSPLQETLDIARELSRNHRVGIISNHANEWSDRIIESHGLEEYFKPIIISSRVDLRKPGLDIYRLALERAGVTPERALFIDDKPENITACRSIGMQGIVFESAEQLRKELDRLSI